MDGDSLARGFSPHIDPEIAKYPKDEGKLCACWQRGAHGTVLGASVPLFHSYKAGTRSARGNNFRGQELRRHGR
jgi:hypothetical protein